MTDPVADLLTQIRNALRNDETRVVVPHSKLKKSILQVMKTSGYIVDYHPDLAAGRAVFRIDLKYGPDGEKVVRHIQRISKPGRRVYRGVEQLPNPLNGMGIAILSTPKGIMSQLDAKAQHVGGEVLCEIW